MMEISTMYENILVNMRTVETSISTSLSFAPRWQQTRRPQSTLRCQSASWSSCLFEEILNSLFSCELTMNVKVTEKSNHEVFVLHFDCADDCFFYQAVDVFSCFVVSNKEKTKKLFYELQILSLLNTASNTFLTIPHDDQTWSCLIMKANIRGLKTFHFKDKLNLSSMCLNFFSLRRVLLLSSWNVL